MGFDKNTILHILAVIPELLVLDISDIKKHLKDFNDIGFSDLDIISITSIVPELLYSFPNELYDKYHSLLEFGYKKEDISKMIALVPFLLKENYITHIDEKIKTLTTFGFSNDIIISISINNPYIFTYSCENITTKLNNLLKIGYSKNEVIELCYNLPFILMKLKNVLEKIKFYKSIDLGNYILQRPIILTYYLELIKGRYMFLSRKISINLSNCGELFLDNDLFNDKYHITTKELLEDV